MPTFRRPIAALAVASLGWAVLALGVSAPVQAAAPAAVPATAPVASGVAERAPHDPATYYAGTDGLTGATLAARLHTIIMGHTKLSYSAVYTALPITDPDPSNPTTYLTDFYSGTPVLSSDRCGSSCGTSGWNREHTWPQSHGDFGTTAGIGTDLFHMRPEYGSTNSSRGNLDFDNTTTGTVPLCSDCRRDSDSFMPRNAVKGDLARGLFYMAVRYEGDSGELNLKMNDLTCNGAGTPNMGKLSTLVAWSLADPPDATERTRNDLIDSDYQHNRNPFIDHPEWVTNIFGDGVGKGPACGSTSGSDYLPGGTTGTVNQAPTATPVTGSTTQGTAVTVALVGSDPDGDPLTWTVPTQPSSGSATVSGSTLTFTPAAGFTGTATIGVTASDGRGASASTTATITVSATTPANQAPTTTPRTGTTQQGTAVSVPLTATDPDGDPLTWSISSQSPSGTATVSGSTLTFTPAAGFTGTATIGVTVADGRGGSASTTVTITVTARPNNAPVAQTSTVTTPEGSATTVTLSATDADGDGLTYTIQGQPAHGSVTLAGAVATYTPAAGYHGADSFTWGVSDGQAMTIGTTTITVTEATNRPPTISGTQLRTTAGSPVSTTLTALAATDPDGDRVTITGVSTPEHGSAALVGTTVTYTPSARSGSDAFIVTVADGRGGVAAARVSVEVTALEAVLHLSSPALTRGTRGSTTIVADGQDGPTPSGLVTLTSGGTSLGQAVLGADGTATVAWTPARAGATALVATYVGDDRYGPTTSAPATVAVKKSAARTTLSAGTLKRGRAGVVKVKVGTVAGVAASGTVTLSVGTKKLKARLVRGVATFRVAKLPTTAKARLVARYAGDAQYLTGTATRTVTLKK